MELTEPRTFCHMCLEEDRLRVRFEIAKSRHTAELYAAA